MPEQTLLEQRAKFKDELERYAEAYMELAMAGQPEDGEPIEQGRSREQSQAALVASWKELLSWASLT